MTTEPPYCATVGILAYATQGACSEGRVCEGSPPPGTPALCVCGEVGPSTDTHKLKPLALRTH